MRDSEMAVLNHLTAEGDWLSIKDIASGSVTSESTVRRVLPNLIYQGLVERRKAVRGHEYRAVEAQVEVQKRSWFKFGRKKKR